MYLKKLLYAKYNEKYLLIILFLFSFFIRIPSIFIFGDTNLEMEWKVLVQYLVDYGRLYSILPTSAIIKVFFKLLKFIFFINNKVADSHR